MDPFGGEMSWPSAIFLVAVVIVAAFLVAIVIVGLFDTRKEKHSAARAEDLRQLAHRFEQLADNTLDAQKRVAADLAELRARTASIEQILLSVE
ncbi:hypothetical protein SSP531S_10640 [Streptomyces spongiicola]|uniref:DNA recombination protein RmuC n=1 Tax=Streptomyces spongiicola TaxID=1690221 RepID=A0A2S1Z896_9ACTN|nr:hypothetical protein [Streptomyces spongiicola]AWK12587.1 hypothetical protein DDQ41_30850 [Streptomyces spongiicola]GBP99669.1 hypothetical protein SSP531S_10640 [Streptomyces spongiicola]